MIKLISGSAKPEWRPVTASTVFPAGSLAYAVSGQLVPADASSGDHVGVVPKAIAATDDDYADERKIQVIVPTSDDIFEADVETGTLTTAMVGHAYDLVADGDAIDVSATSKKVVTIVGFVSASKALIKINAMDTNVNVATS